MNGENTDPVVVEVHEDCWFEVKDGCYSHSKSECRGHGHPRIEINLEWVVDLEAVS